MSLRFASLGSGSKGNATLVAFADQLILIDCGFGLRTLQARLAELSVSPAEITAVFISHEHIDHVRGLSAFVRKFAPPVWMSHGTWRGLKDQNFPSPRFIHGNGQSCVSVGALSVSPLTVPHDANEPTQFVIESPEHRLVVLTDLGRVTAHVRERAAGVDAMILECNHDVERLQAGPYPERLKQRIRSGFGHLGNDCAARFARELAFERLQHLALAHLSESNNTPELAREAISAVIPAEAKTQLRVLSQGQVSPWMVLT